MSKPKATQVDLYWISHLYRAIARRLTPIFIALRFSGNQVTLLSCAIALFGSAVLVVLSPTTLLVSAACLHMFAVLDHVDGDVARYWARVNPGSTQGRSGMYFDQLVHFFQGPSFFACLGLGLTLVAANVLWAVFGIVASIASGAFPWLVAQRTYLATIVMRPADDLTFAREHIVPTIFESPSRIRSDRVPSRFEQATWVLKQAFGGPNTFLVFSAAALIDFVMGSFIASQVFLLAFSVMKAAATIMATRSYMRAFKGLVDS